MIIFFNFSKQHKTKKNPIILSASVTYFYDTEQTIINKKTKTYGVFFFKIIVINV